MTATKARLPERLPDQLRARFEALGYRTHYRPLRDRPQLALVNLYPQPGSGRNNIPGPFQVDAARQESVRGVQNRWVVLREAGTRDSGREVQRRRNLRAHGDAYVRDEPQCRIGRLRYRKRFGQTETTKVRLGPAHATALQKGSQFMTRAIALANCQRGFDRRCEISVSGRGFRGKRTLEPEDSPLVHFSGKGKGSHLVKAPQCIHGELSVRPQPVPQQVKQVEEFFGCAVVKDLEDSESPIPSICGLIDPLFVRAAAQSG